MNTKPNHNLQYQPQNLILKASAPTLSKKSTSRGCAHNNNQNSPEHWGHPAHSFSHSHFIFHICGCDRQKLSHTAPGVVVAVVVEAVVATVVVGDAVVTVLPAAITDRVSNPVGYSENNGNMYIELVFEAMFVFCAYSIGTRFGCCRGCCRVGCRSCALAHRVTGFGRRHTVPILGGDTNI